MQELEIINKQKRKLTRNSLYGRDVRVENSDWLEFKTWLVYGFRWKGLKFYFSNKRGISNRVSFQGVKFRVFLQHGWEKAGFPPWWYVLNNGKAGVGGETPEDAVDAAIKAIHDLKT